MKESISATVLFIIVIVLVVLFAGVVSFSANKSNSFSVLDRVVSIIEDYGYFDLSSDNEYNISDPVLNEIVDVLGDSSYRQEGNCDAVVSSMFDLKDEFVSDDVEYSSYSRDGKKVSDNASFCIVRVKGVDTGSLNSYYYRVIVFYNLDLPVIKGLFNFYNVGDTKSLYK